MKRMRLIGWNVQPVVLVDDGENLTPVSINTKQILAAQWEAWKAGGDAGDLEGLRVQIEVESGPDVKSNGHDPAERLPVETGR